MKYWNKGKKYRESWYKVEGPEQFQTGNLKRWCQTTGTNGRFFFEGPTISPSIFPSFPSLIRVNPQVWYFENSEDALAFKLTWAQKISNTK